MKIIKYLLSLAVAAMICGCSKDTPVDPDGGTPAVKPIERGTFAKGADVSWLTELEASGYTFRAPGGSQKELMELLRDDCGVNAIRLRVFVNPENSTDINGWCDIDDVLVKAIRANSLGLRVMIDFHFSDTWADPGKQFIPAAWEGMSIDEVLVAMAAHVDDMLQALKSHGVEPEWVQIGNETRTGMMWPLGKYDNRNNFSRMVTAGYNAVKAVFPDAAVIVHCDCGNQEWLYTTLFGTLEQQGAKYDMIGMSLYPEEKDWETTVDQCIANIKKVQRAYGKPVMICEVGFDYRKPEIADQMMRRLMDGARTAGAKGIFWWEPEAPVDRGYSKGCFNINGEPTAALSCFNE